jgi:hypothetical protein
MKKIFLVTLFPPSRAHRFLNILCAMYRVISDLRLNSYNLSPQSQKQPLQSIGSKDRAATQYCFSTICSKLEP